LLLIGGATTLSADIGLLFDDPRRARRMTR
jgi:hypothetical protein